MKQEENIKESIQDDLKMAKFKNLKEKILFFEITIYFKPFTKHFIAMKL